MIIDIIDVSPLTDDVDLRRPTFIYDPHSFEDWTIDVGFDAREVPTAFSFYYKLIHTGPFGHHIETTIGSPVQIITNDKRINFNSPITPISSKTVAKDGSTVAFVYGSAIIEAFAKGYNFTNGITTPNAMILDVIHKYYCSDLEMTEIVDVVNEHIPMDKVDTTLANICTNDYASSNVKTNSILHLIKDLDNAYDSYIWNRDQVKPNTILQSRELDIGSIHYNVSQLLCAMFLPPVEILCDPLVQKLAKFQGLSMKMFSAVTNLTNMGYVVTRNYYDEQMFNENAYRTDVAIEARHQVAQVLSLVDNLRYTAIDITFDQFGLVQSIHVNDDLVNSFHERREIHSVDVRNFQQTGVAGPEIRSTIEDLKLELLYTAVANMFICDKRRIGGQLQITKTDTDNVYIHNNTENYYFNIPTWKLSQICCPSPEETNIIYSNVSVGCYPHE